MFSKSLSPFEELKTNKSVFKSDPEVLSCFELNYKFLERHEKPLSLATTRKQENPVNTAQKMASQSSTKQNGEAPTEDGGSARVDCHIYRRRNKYLQRRHGPWKHEKEYAACNRPESWYLEKYKTELNLNSISKTFQGTYHISIATLNFQCFRLDTSFLSVLPPKR